MVFLSYLCNLCNRCNLCNLNIDHGVATIMTQKLNAHIAVDLMAHTTGTRVGITAYHPGVILVNYLGYPGTMGAFSDFIMVDKYSVPPDMLSSEVSEYAVYLPHHYQANDFPLSSELYDYEKDLVQDAAVLNNAKDSLLWPLPLLDPWVAQRNSLQLKINQHKLIHPLYSDDQPQSSSPEPEQQQEQSSTTTAPKVPPSSPPPAAAATTFTYCNFNTIAKMEPVMFRVWLDILARVPNSLLWLLQPKGKMGKIVVANLKREAASRGVNPKRIVMAQRMSKFEHFDRLRFCDLFLDTFIYTAHSTASDVLWAGVPLLTIRGDTFASRVASTLLTNIGVGKELVVHTKMEFIDRAVELGGGSSSGSSSGSSRDIGVLQNRKKRYMYLLRHLRRKIAHGLLWYPLFDTERLTSNIERAYEAMWDVRASTLNNNNNNNRSQRRLRPHKVKFGTFMNVGPSWIRYHLVIHPKAGIHATSTQLSTLIQKKGIQTSLSLYNQGDLIPATNILRRVLVSAPSHAESWHLLGLLRHRQGYSEYGASCVNEAVRLQPHVFLYRNNAIELFRSANLLQQAVQHADSLLTMHQQLLQDQQRSHSESIEHDSLSYSFEELPLDTFRALFDHLISKNEDMACLQLYDKYEVIFMSKNRHHSNSNKRRKIVEMITSVSMCAFTASNKSNKKNKNKDLSLHYYEKSLKLLQWCVKIDPEYDVGWMKLATLYDHGDRFQKSLQHYSVAFEKRHNVIYDSALRSELRIEENRRRARKEGKAVLVIYCDEYGQTWWPNWGPSSMDQGGAGGSEEAVIFLSEELQRLDSYHVEVYTNPKKEEWGVHPKTNVSWYPLESYDQSSFRKQQQRPSPFVAESAPSTEAPPVSLSLLSPLSPPPPPCDIFVSWRYHISMFAGDDSRSLRYLWLQDISSRFKEQYTKDFTSSLNGVFVLSHFHAEHGLPRHLLTTKIAPKTAPKTASKTRSKTRSKTTITPNGLDARYYVENGSNSNSHFIYASAPNRGLREVLLAWHIIRKHVPNAILSVYYGFTNSFMKYGKSTIPQFDIWYTEMLELLKQEGVTYYGMVNHHVLANAYAEAGFYLYPTIFPETGCVALMKAMALGAIPITSRNPNSTLPELTKHWDLGPRRMEERRAEVALDIDIDIDIETIKTVLMDGGAYSVWYEDWIRRVVKAATLPLKAERLKREKRNEQSDGLSDGLNDNAFKELKDVHDLEEYRMLMMKESQHRFLWSTVASTWHHVFKLDRETMLLNDGENALPTLRDVFAASM